MINIGTWDFINTVKVEVLTIKIMTHISFITKHV